MSNGDKWVRVDHMVKEVTMFINDGQPFTKSGGYMSIDYFNTIKVSMPEVNTYKVIDKTFNTKER